MSTDRLLIRVPSSRISDRSPANKSMISTAEAKEVKSTVLTMMMSSVFTVSVVLQFPGILGRRRQKRPYCLVPEKSEAQIRRLSVLNGLALPFPLPKTDKFKPGGVPFVLE